MSFYFLTQVQLVEKFLVEEISKRVPEFSMEDFTQALMWVGFGWYRACVYKQTLQALPYFTQL